MFIIGLCGYNDARNVLLIDEDLRQIGLLDLRLLVPDPERNLLIFVVGDSCVFFYPSPTALLALSAPSWDGQRLALRRTESSARSDNSSVFEECL
jgi:hypothetical protein